MLTRKFASDKIKKSQMSGKEKLGLWKLNREDKQSLKLDLN
jgi:hypothetical protein